MRHLLITTAIFLSHSNWGSLLVFIWDLGPHVHIWISDSHVRSMTNENICKDGDKLEYEIKCLPDFKVWTVLNMNITVFKHYLSMKITQQLMHYCFWTDITVKQLLSTNSIAQLKPTRIILIIKNIHAALHSGCLIWVAATVYTVCMHN